VQRKATATHQGRLPRQSATATFHTWPHAATGCHGRAHPPPATERHSHRRTNANTPPTGWRATTDAHTRILTHRRHFRREIMARTKIHAPSSPPASKKPCRRGKAEVNPPATVTLRSHDGVTFDVDTEIASRSLLVNEWMGTGDTNGDFHLLACSGAITKAHTEARALLHKRHRASDNQWLIAMLVTRYQVIEYLNYHHRAEGLSFTDDLKNVRFVRISCTRTCMHKKASIAVPGTHSIYLAPTHCPYAQGWEKRYVSVDVQALFELMMCAEELEIQSLSDLAVRSHLHTPSAPPMASARGWDPRPHPPSVQGDC